MPCSDDDEIRRSGLARHELIRQFKRGAPFNLFEMLALGAELLAHVTWARSSAPKSSISNRLNGAPRLNCRMSSCRARPERRISSSSEHGILGVTCRTLPIPV